MSFPAITDNSAMSGGNVTSDGAAPIISRGVCWSKTANPTTSDEHTTDSTGTGSFTSAINDLSPGTLYHVRAYATNSAGTAYGEDVTFTTSTTAPTVTTTAVSSVMSTSAMSGGNVTSGGGASVTARGVCWSTSSNPTTEDACSSDGTGTGSFTSNVTGLAPDTLYYVRAYATNSAGTGYGETCEFTTDESLPDVGGVPDTGQTKCYNNSGEMVCPQPGEAFHGQDAAYLINPPLLYQAGCVRERSPGCGHRMGHGAGQCDGAHLGGKNG